MFGIGGGVVMVPVLVLLGRTLPEASGASLTAMMAPVGIFAALQYYKNDLLDLRAAAVVAFGLLCGVVFGAKFALTLPAGVLKQIYGVFLLWVCWRFFDPASLFKRKNKSVAHSDGNTPRLIALLPLGLFAGVLSGMFGIGGGLIIVPVLISIYKFDAKKAIGTSLAALLPPVALPGVIEYYNAGLADLTVAGILALGLTVGSIAGAKITIGAPPGRVKRVYSVFLLIMAIYFISSGF